MKVCTDGYGCIVFDSTVSTMEVSKCVFWYKAPPPDETKDRRFIMGNRNYWKLHYMLYKGPPKARNNREPIPALAPPKAKRKPAAGGAGTGGGEGAPAARRSGAAAAAATSASRRGRGGANGAGAARDKAKGRIAVKMVRPKARVVTGGDPSAAGRGHGAGTRIVVNGPSAARGNAQGVDDRGQASSAQGSRRRWRQEGER